MNIDVLNYQDLYDIHEQNLREYSEWIMLKVQQLNPAITWQELSLVLQDDSIRTLNKEWFQKDTVTDVISFAYTQPPATGEVIVNMQQAKEEGGLRESPDRELALYIAHGCHHLMGAEDDTPKRKKHMLEIENAWVDEAILTLKIGPFFL